MVKTGKSALQRWIMLCTVLVIAVTFRSAAQCSYRDNGHIFLHPYFTEGNWKAALFESAFIGSETMCEEKPVQLAFSKYDPVITIVYTTADGKWLYGTAPLEDNDCICCRPGIEYGTMQPVTFPEGVSLNAEIPFIILNRGEADADNIVIVAATGDNSVVALQMNIGDGTIASSYVELPFEKTISGIWEDAGANTSDGVWIGGSNGLLTYVPYSGGVWQEAQEYSLDGDETVTSVGGGYLGTASGNIYAIGEGTCTRESEIGTDAIRFITNAYAVGDNGTVIIKKQNQWSDFSDGDADYRYARLSAGLQGSVIELLDDVWNYSSDTLFNEKTTIKDASPEEVFDSLNKGPFRFEGLNTNEIDIILDDPDGNFTLPDVFVKSNSTTTDILGGENGTDILAANPAALCTDGNTYFDEHGIHFEINYSSVTIRFQTKKSSDNTATCGFWQWEEELFEMTVPYAPDDELHTILDTDTLIIINGTPTVTSLGTNNRELQTDPFQMRGNRLHVNMSEGNTVVRSVAVFNSAGRKVWQVHGSSHSQISPSLPAGIYFAKIEYDNRKVITHRIVSSGQVK